MMFFRTSQHECEVKEGNFLSRARITHLGDIKVARQEAPVHVSPITDVGVVAVCCC
jgi:hypothetical protein